MASVPIQLGDEEGVIRWVISQKGACVKEPLDGRGLLVTFDPEWESVDSELGDRVDNAIEDKPRSAKDDEALDADQQHFLHWLDQDIDKGIELEDDTFEEWEQLGLPRVTAFVSYNAAVAANHAMHPHRRFDPATSCPVTVVYHWSWWIERQSNGWVLHWPGKSAGKLGYESKRMAKDYSRFVKSWKPKPIRYRGALRISEGEQDYLAAFGEVREGIEAGEFYLANLTMNFGCDLGKGDGLHDLTTIDAAELYLRLRRICPAPQGCFLKLGTYEFLLSASPERLFKATTLWVEDTKSIETHPIKGTRPVRSDPIENQREIESLIASEKENAELTMIVDLERNDLSRICMPHSVVVDGGFRVESTPHVHHRVATVKGVPYNYVPISDILAAGFPGGSVTGAPKIAAVNALTDIEHSNRGPYCGSILWIGVDGTLDSSILIRTIFLSGMGASERVVFGTGGGITIDSDPQAEYLECFQKAQAMAEALEPWVDITMVRDALAGRRFPQQRDWWTEKEVMKVTLGRLRSQMAAAESAP